MVELVAVPAIRRDVADRAALRREQAREVVERVDVAREATADAYDGDGALDEGAPAYRERGSAAL